MEAVNTLTEEGNGKYQGYQNYQEYQGLFI